MDASGEALLERIGQISVRVHDLDRAVEFYRDRLGIPFLFRVPGMAFLDCGGIRLMLALPEDDEFDHPSSVLYFEVEGIERAHDQLRAEGVEFEDGPRKVADLESAELWMAFFRDPDRNLMALMDERPREG